MKRMIRYGMKPVRYRIVVINVLLDRKSVV